jgi:hypothetical protein
MVAGLSPFKILSYRAGPRILARKLICINRVVSADVHMSVANASMENNPMNALEQAGTSADTLGFPRGVTLLRDPLLNKGTACSGRR